MSSALIHLLVVIAFPYFNRYDPPAPRRSTTAAPMPEGIRIVVIAPTDEDEPAPEESTERPEPERPPPRPERPARTADVEPPPTTGDADAASPAERLTPGRGDPRLWTMPPGHRAAPSSDIERSRARLAAGVGEIADSILMAEANARWLRDWTHIDDDGDRWGITPDGKLHLGGLLGRRRPSVEFPRPPDVVERLREWELIRGRADLIGIDRLLRERSDSIRERKDAVRSRRRGGSH